MKYILATGVSSGIGLGITKCLIKEGYHVIGSVRSNQKGLELSSVLGRQFTPLVFDINRRKEIELSAEKMPEILKNHHLTAIINNAGFAEIGPLLHVSMDDLRKHLETLVMGQLSVIQIFYEYLIPSQSDIMPGRIINISSISGKYGNPFFGCYCAGKHALEGLSKTLRKELEIFGIKLIVVAPGNIATAIWRRQTADMAERYKATVYYDRLVSYIEYINNTITKDAMTIDEFVDAFMQIFQYKEPADRYTVLKTKSRLPFSGIKVRIIKG